MLFHLFYNKALLHFSVSFEAAKIFPGETTAKKVVTFIVAAFIFSLLYKSKFTGLFY